ncbi:hypothetical protein Rt10032_c11g4620 [Rhodotorula toruloides]|uniref:WW domain-containing protein n=1 Tax=Rhodotorula toruloides TaxID=5286 RepID=A0A511KJR0_RHOTO|nr:hypothetical protein Rt10032_c11g4620 [Rhodotorula toruloides]
MLARLQIRVLTSTTPPTPADKQHFYVDTRANPPRSIWVHPDDEPGAKPKQTYAPPTGPPPSNDGNRASPYPQAGNGGAQSNPPPYQSAQSQPGGGYGGPPPQGYGGGYGPQDPPYGSYQQPPQPGYDYPQQQPYGGAPYGGYPQQQPMYMQQPQYVQSGSRWGGGRIGGGGSGMGMGLAGAGVGLLGGMVAMNAIDGMQDHAYEEGHEDGQDNGGGYDDGGGDFGDGGGDF